ncbi:PspC domain-containing protein [Virgibacillus necropolis]|uniref:PspC domain-containing protein n=1 Tax=Virgibacillus necropolis TaxID=163877 RepID=A0A221MAR0_9BACI|nr:PspC domain-containing protein [Virgibacillus necropolis]ASN04746.1 PspC domain-containing protein [Virgibacillus necropolis]
MKRLTRLNSDRMVAGVLGGLAQYFSIDSTIVRVVFVILTIMSVFVLLLIYFAAMIIIPKEQEIR